MKKIFLLLSISGLTVISKAQSVGIGTTTPNSKAALDISSTTQGVLIPRMTTTERNAILFPPDGLLIFNTTTKMLNQRQDGVWKAMINNYSWEGGGTGKM
ncbi:MAG TPA: hypothetical protein PLU37_14210, partial [Chitinophagaceae bacterium]|nr:hypothetical protein [Chitinophagaceae bacterium]